MSDVYAFVGPNGAGKTHNARRTGLQRVEFATPLKRHVQAFIFEQYGIELSAVHMEQQHVKDMWFYEYGTVRDMLHAESARIKNNNPFYLCSEWASAAKEILKDKDIVVSDMRTMCEYSIAKKIANEAGGDLFVVRVEPFRPAEIAKDAVDNGWEEIPYDHVLTRNNNNED